MTKEVLLSGLFYALAITAGIVLAKLAHGIYTEAAAKPAASTS